MRTESCREWRESLGAYSLGHLASEDKAALEAHLEGCAGCRAEADSLDFVSRLLPHADPEHFGPAPVPPAALGERIATQIGAERRRGRQRRRLRRGLALSGASAAVAAVALAIFVLPGGSGGAPAQRVVFRSLPLGVKIAATLQPRAFGTEISMYVSGMHSGTLCHVYLREADGARFSAGTFRYRWGGNGEAVLSSALDLSQTAAISVQAGGHTFVAPVSPAGPSAASAPPPPPCSGCPRGTMAKVVRSAIDFAIEIQFLMA
ncbi:MAG TPA: anti-sigma factor [Solirubrobacterales bacterium]|nr:anti-sigma factor [Solirubrobacterales bacterium]